MTTKVSQGQITEGEDVEMNELIEVEVRDGRQIVSAKDLYLGLGLHKAGWSRWQVVNIINNEFFEENVDWFRVHLVVEGNETMDFAITLEFGKHIAMMARTKESHDYRNYFIEVEKKAKELYHVSETALTNNVMKEIESKLIDTIDDRLEIYEENFRPTHANKIKINSYIKDSLGVDIQPNESNLVKQRVLLMLDAESWQDVPYKKLINNMRLIDESIKAVKSFRERQQLDLFDSYL